MSLFDDVHCRTRIFSLIGRPVILTHEYYPNKPGVIVAKGKGMNFRIRLDSGSEIWFARADFKLPPLPPEQRRPEWVSDYSSGFDYEGLEGF
ncbi:MAG: hypothetical protein WC315_00725 [Candidatus Omnitrophota bacterium]|jgi:hypothetical protein